MNKFLEFTTSRQKHASSEQEKSHGHYKRSKQPIIESQRARRLAAKITEFVSILCAVTGCIRCETEKTCFGKDIATTELTIEPSDLPAAYGPDDENHYQLDGDISIYH